MTKQSNSQPSKVQLTVHKNIEIITITEDYFLFNFEMRLQMRFFCGCRCDM